MSVFRDQFGTLIHLRWQLFRNSMRFTHRRQELAAQFLGYAMAAFFVIGAAIGIFAGTIAMLRAGRPEFIDILLWVVFIVWQLGPILFEGYSPGLNFREIARYPVSFRLYFLLNGLYGLLDPVGLVALLWLSCLWLGIAIGRPAWAIPAALALLVFAVLNLFLNRMLVGLLERFQSTRKGRERMVIVLLVLMLLPQFLQLLTGNWTRGVTLKIPHAVVAGFPVLHRISPPGAAAEVFRMPFPGWLLGLILLACYTALLFLLLRQHLRSIFEGEIYSERRVPHRLVDVRPGWKIPGLDGATAAIIEKELRYVRQNTRIIVQLVYPIIVFFLLFFTSSSRRGFSFFMSGKPMVMLGGLSAFILLGVGNLAYNLFGLDEAGFSRWLLSPVSLQKVFLAKNLALCGIIGALYVIAAAGMAAFYRFDLLSLATITLAFVLVLCVQMMIGNWVSVYWPKRVDLARMNSRLVSNAAGLVSMLALLPLGTIGTALVFATFFFHLPWLPLAVCLLLLVVTLKLYTKSLDWVAGFALQRLDQIEKELTS